MTKGTLFLTNMYCPVCGEDVEANMLNDGYLTADPKYPTLECRNCWTKFRIGLYEVIEKG